MREPVSHVENEQAARRCMTCAGLVAWTEKYFHLQSAPNRCTITRLLKNPLLPVLQHERCIIEKLCERKVDFHELETAFISGFVTALTAWSIFHVRSFVEMQLFCSCWLMKGFLWISFLNEVLRKMYELIQILLEATESDISRRKSECCQPCCGRNLAVFKWSYVCIWLERHLQRWWMCNKLLYVFQHDRSIHTPPSE